MGRLLILVLCLVAAVSSISGCSVINQADAKDLSSQPVQISTTPLETATTPVLTTTQTTETQAATNGPASFSLSGLTIEPREVATAELFTISVTVTNTGGSQGSYNTVLQIDEVDTTDPENVTLTTIDTIHKSVTVTSGASKTVVFDSLSLPEGTYTATIADLVDYFEVGC